MDYEMTKGPRKSEALMLEYPASFVCNVLPSHASFILWQASNIGMPMSIERINAINLATKKVRQMYPNFFRPNEDLNRPIERIKHVNECFYKGSYIPRHNRYRNMGDL